MLRRWERVLANAERLDPAALRTVRSRAVALSQRLGRVLHETDKALATTGQIPRPLHADWAWRPELWAGPVEPFGAVSVASGVDLSDAVKLFHDCSQRAITARQVRAHGPAMQAPFALRLEVYQFEGSFMSVAIDLPETGVRGMSTGQILRVAPRYEVERPLDVYARLNLRHGPNVAHVVRRMDGDAPVDLDLAEMDIDDGCVSGGWVDIIFEAPAMNHILIRDVTLSRRPRAAF